MEAVVKNAADEEQVERAKVKDKTGRDREIDDLKFVLNSKSGRRFVWRLLEQCGLFRSSFTGNSQTYFLEGERNVGLKILTDINDEAPEAYVQMLKESKGDLNG